MSAYVGGRVDVWASFEGRTFELGHTFVASLSSDADGNPVVKADMAPLSALLRRIADTLDIADEIDRIAEVTP